MGESNFAIGILIASCALLIVGIIFTAVEIQEYNAGPQVGMPTEAREPAETEDEGEAVPEEGEGEAVPEEGEDEGEPTDEAAPEVEGPDAILPGVDEVVPEAKDEAKEEEGEEKEAEDKGGDELPF
jgi:hypothetical protein